MRFQPDTFSINSVDNIDIRILFTFSSSFRPSVKFFILGTMRLLLLLIGLLTSQSLSAQLSDPFTDGDFTANPEWSGSRDHFTVQEGQLQSNGPNATATIYLSTPNSMSSNTEWRFFLKLTFSPSDANHARIYLMSDQVDLTSEELNGYFIRIGENGSNDGIDLWRQQGRTLTKIIDGLPGTVAINPSVRVRVIRDVLGNWQVWADPAGGSQWEKQGSAKDATLTECTYFGLMCLHTATNRQRFFFDDFEIREAPIGLSQVVARGEKSVQVRFSKKVEPVSAQKADHYRLDGNVGVIRATQDPSDPAMVWLELDTPLSDNQLYTLNVEGVADTEGDSILPGSTAQFRYLIPVRYNELVISEIFADESPQVGLPDAEYLELHNRTSRSISLNRFRLYFNNGSGLFPDSLIRPGEYVILCAHSQVSKLSTYGKVIGLSNFTLNNTGMTLSLRDAGGKLIFSVSYSDTWYQSAVKKEGGWSLEMMDQENPCGEAQNWTASENPSGGTPGKANSVAVSRPDLTPPQVLRVDINSPTQLKVVFNEKLDSLSTVNISAYALDKNISIQSVQVESPAFRQVNLTLSAPLQPRTTYSLQLSGLTDCAGNLMASDTRIAFVLPETGDSSDVVLNEVLFNPRSGGVDFVEIYNRSDKFISLKDWQLANVGDGVIANGHPIATEPLIMEPRQYKVLTTSEAALKSHYPKSKAENFLVIPSLPSYPDAAGTVILLNQNSRLIDRFDYSEDFHFALIKDKNGVSLERISFNSRANDPAGWQSAASTEDYATPGYRNSQFQIPVTNPGGLVVEPRVFTPDEDGFNDFTTLSYAFGTGGNVASIRIFDVRGREVKRLAQNQTLASEGYFRWDGTNDRGEKVRTGYYIIHIELFDLQGKTQDFREKVVVGAKF